MTTVKKQIYYLFPKQGSKKFSSKKELIQYLEKHSSDKSLIIKGKEATVEISNKPIITVNL